MKEPEMKPVSHQRQADLIQHSAPLFAKRQTLFCWHKKGMSQRPLGLQ